ncbi:hypothetical protein [Anderseniella sp. Alg231-50]|uniref:hypothetical protein n=1 Tax=Anderseniella sp. Alg231-50 TaxID=1922226 RepID=UPI00307C27A3
MSHPQLTIRKPDYALRDPIATATAEAVLKYGYCSLGALREALHCKLWSTQRHSPDLKLLKKQSSEYLREFRLSPEKWFGRVDKMLADAVKKGELQLFGWPAGFDDAGIYVIEDPPQKPVRITGEILNIVWPLHRRLPNVHLGLKPASISRLAGGQERLLAPDAFVVMDLKQASRWVENDRLKGEWPSQQGQWRTIASPAPKRGRPSRRGELYEPIVGLVETGQWSGAKSVAKLLRLLEGQLGRKKLSRDTVTRTVDELANNLADPRYKRRSRKL